MTKTPAWPSIAGADNPRWPIVLLYHSISDPRGDPWGVRVSPEHFAQQMAVIATHCTPMRLADVLPAVKQGGVPRRGVIVTFDDGYIDNLTIAKPILERFGIPATVFVSSGYVNREDEYWWDELERLVLQPGWMSRRLSVTIGCTTHDWRIGSDGFLPWVRWKLQRRRNRYYAYHTSPEETRLHTARQRVYRPLWEALRAAPSVAEREQALTELRKQSRPSIKPRSANRCVAATQLQQLAQGDLIEIGAHAVLHPSMGHLSRDLQRAEIEESKHALEAIVQTPVESFAYPFGEHCDYNQDSIDLLREAGFKQACTNAFPREPVTSDVSPFTIPRQIAQDSDGGRFASALARMFLQFGGGDC